MKKVASFKLEAFLSLGLVNSSLNYEQKKKEEGGAHRGFLEKHSSQDNCSRDVPSSYVLIIITE